MSDTFDELPDVLTVDEAAELLRISRNTAYAMAREWRATGGRTGLPVVELRPHILRVPKLGLTHLLSGASTAE